MSEHREKIEQMQNLIVLLNQASRVYYQESREIMPNIEYDRLYDMLEALWEDYMMNGKINPVSGIFLGKNHFGYQDKQEYVLTPNQKNEVDPVAIEAKYAELPEE